MIILTIVLIIAGVVIAALAIIAYNAIASNSRWSRRCHDLAAAHAKRHDEISDLQAELQHAQAENTDLSEALERTRVLYNKVLREHRELEARNTALVEAMQARPTQPKRTVRKSSTQATEQERKEEL